MYSVLYSLLLVVPLAGAIPIPLTATFDHHDASQHGAEMTKFNDALGVANTQIANMQKALENPDDPRIAQAFGPKADLATIKSTVDKLANGVLKVHTSDPNFADQEAAEHAKDAARKKGNDVSQMPNSRPVNGFVPVDTGTGERVTDPARFGSTFYSGNTENDKKFRAGTIIHEATHYLSATGDHVAPGNRILKAGVKKPDGTISNGGYAERPIIKDDADMGERYTSLREASPNMEHNADSYRVFASLCSRSLLKRALEQDDPVEYYLAKRQQCSLPPDYFKKKAAAAKASGATATSANTPTEKGATKAKAGVKDASSAKSLNNLKATKARKARKTGDAVNSPKGVKATKTGKASNAVKGAQTSKGGKTTKNKVTASRAAGKKTTTPRASTKVTGKTAGGAVKATKSVPSRSSQKVAKTAPKPVRKTAANVSTSKKAGKRN